MLWFLVVLHQGGLTLLIVELPDAQSVLATRRYHFIVWGKCHALNTAVTFVGRQFEEKLSFVHIPDRDKSVLAASREESWALGWVRPLNLVYSVSEVFKNVRWLRFLHLPDTDSILRAA